MDHDAFVSLVREQGGLPDGARAEATAHTALQTLGSRLSGGAARALATHLPEQEAAALTARPAGDEAAPGDIEDLAADLAQSAGIDPLDAANVMQATIRAIAESVDDEHQLNLVRDQLPPNLATLFGPAEERGAHYRSASGG